ncbi:multiple PDZ domain protein-like isoform X2 [Homalodisca vitripennis]|nr:multiple PDZ domain protein-like isoform X2 [Homalodisca vitripennis]
MCLLGLCSQLLYRLPRRKPPPREESEEYDFAATELRKYEQYVQDKVKKKYGNLGPGVVMVQVEKGHQGLGISLAGHKDRNRMAVFVCGINPKGSAYKTGGIQVGDEILEVNGVVLHGRCHLNASAIIKGLPGNIFKVIVLRKTEGLENLAVKPITQFPVSLDDETPEQRYANFKGLRTVAIKKTGQGLGIMIIEGKHAEVGQGIFISDIQEGSAAEQAGLIVGDMILAVNKDTLLGSNYDAAAALLKKTEGVVSLVVCNPNKAKAEEKAADGAPARSPTPQPPKEPEKPRLTGKSVVHAISPSTSGKLAEEPPADPATAPVNPGRESTIEINKDKMGLGLSIVGGSDTLLGVIIIHEVYPDGAAAKDGRLKPGDQILEVNSEDFRSITHSKALAALRQTPAKVKMVVLRDEGVVSGKEEELMDIMEVELTKKPGKGLGLSIVGRKNGPGIFISDVVQGGTAGTDGRLMKGDQILAVNGQDLKNSTQEEAAAVLKTAAGKVTMKLGRLKASESGGMEPAEAEGWRTVVLERGPDGLGFSIVGGHQSPYGDLPIYVKTVFAAGVAAGGGLRHGDQILAVDGLSMQGLTHQQAVAVLKRAQGTVTLTIQS